MSNSKKLTRKQLAFISEFKKDPTASYKALALRAGYAPATAHNATKEITPACKTVLLAELEKIGVNDEVLAKKINEGMNAFSIKSHYDPDKGGFIDDKPKVDFANRHKYVETLMKHRGLLKDVIEHSGTIGFTPVPLDEKRENHLDAELGTVFKKKRK